tara:strand:- start:4534 stop:5040 length:507 start_codon:yes stop_codon:yes gene_type:complete
MKEEFINQSLTRILKFATGAHEGQKRKYSDEDYITHPIEVAKRVNHKHVDEQMTAAALLHDVLEDTKVTHLEMRTFLHTVYSVEMAERVLSLVVELTDVFTHEDFPNMNRKSRKGLEALRLYYVSDDAKKIKLVDIEHNSESILKKDPKFAKVFLEEKKELLKYLKIK